MAPERLTAATHGGMIGAMFHDRRQAGAALARALHDLHGRPNVTVVGIASGGAEVAAEVAARLDTPLDIICIRKAPLPGHPELAVGAVAPQGERYTNRRIAALLTVRELEELYDAATAQARAMDERIREGLPLNVLGRAAVIVDDGAATAASVRAAMAAVRNAGARQIIVALPVLPRPAAEQLALVCHRLIALETPAQLRAIADFYESYEPVSETRVAELAAAAATEPAPVK
jgi:putative phosphoribosyl transferase